MEFQPEMDPLLLDRPAPPSSLPGLPEPSQLSDPTIQELAHYVENLIGTLMSMRVDADRRPAVSWDIPEYQTQVMPSNLQQLSNLNTPGSLLEVSLFCLSCLRVHFVNLFFSGFMVSLVG